MSLTKQQILEADDLKIEKVSCPEWGGDVYVKTLTGEERDSFESIYAAMKETKTIANFRARLVAFSTCDKEGHIIFTQEDVSALGRKSSRPISRLFNRAMKLSGIGDKDLEEMVKN